MFLRIDEVVVRACTDTVQGDDQPGVFRVAHGFNDADDLISAAEVGRKGGRDVWHDAVMHFVALPGADDRESVADLFDERVACANSQVTAGCAITALIAPIYCESTTVFASRGLCVINPSRNFRYTFIP